MAKRETQKLVDEMTAMDDTFFHKLVESKSFCEELIQTVLNKKCIRLIEVTPQKSLRNVKGRSVVLDVYCIDTEKASYDVEMQQKDDVDHQRRVRYNASNMDTYITDKGIKFEQVPDAYVIYISKNDFFEEGKTIYHVDRVLRETGEVLDNGFYEIYVNAQIDDGSDLAELMKILNSPKVPENSKFPNVCAEIKSYKVGEGREIMCAIVEEYAAKKAKEAAKKADEKTARKMLMSGKFEAEEIINWVSLLSLEEVKEIQKSITRTS